MEWQAAVKIKESGRFNSSQLSSTRNYTSEVANKSKKKRSDNTYDYTY
jgi:hypothetical protein